jgi:hypothetical protein
MKHFFLSCLILIIILSANAVADPTPINDEADLLALMNTVDPATDWSADYILMADLDMTVETCSPIGNDNDPFTGSFDGNGHTISNVTINGDGGDDDYIGFFGFIGQEGVVYDLTLENVDMTGDSFVGGFVGTNLGQIMNCTVSGEVTAFEAAGGFAGQNFNSIDNCSSSCNVLGEGEGDSYIYGGFVGSNSFDYTQALETETLSITMPVISNCSASGNVECSAGAGGFVSLNIGYIYNCTATGNVEGEDFLSGFCVSNGLGFLLFYLDISGDFTSNAISVSDIAEFLQYFSVIKNCSATGNVTGDDESYLVSGFCSSNILGRILNSRYNGRVEGSFLVAGFCNINIISNILSSRVGNGSSVRGDVITAGFVSVNLGNVSESHTFASVYCSEYSGAGFVSMNGLDIDGIGLDGLVGSSSVSDTRKRHTKKYFSSRTKNPFKIQEVVSLVDELEDLEELLYNFIKGIATISNCSAKGNVYGSDCAGGFVDFNGINYTFDQVDQSSVSDIIPLQSNFDFNYLTITECFSTGSVSGYWEVGGFCGGNYAGTITNCYSTGNATGIDEPEIGGQGDESFLEGTYVGGFCGFSEENSIDYCFSTGNASGGDATGGFLGCNSSSSFTCCYWNTTNNFGLDGVGEGSNSHTDSEIVGLTSSQMGQASNFTCLIENNPSVWFMTDGGPILNGTTLPTLTEWAVILFIGLLAGVGGWFVWRRMT